MADKVLAYFQLDSTDEAIEFQECFSYFDVYHLARVYFSQHSIYIEIIGKATTIKNGAC